MPLLQPPESPIAVSLSLPAGALTVESDDGSPVDVPDEAVPALAELGWKPATAGKAAGKVRGK